LVVAAAEGLRLPAPEGLDRVADPLGVRQLVPGDDLGDRALGHGVSEKALHLVIEDAQARAGDADIGVTLLDPAVGLVPYREEVLRVIEPRGPVEAPLPRAEHV